MPPLRPSGPARRAVFLDRDGTLNPPVIVAGRPHPPARLEDFQLYPGASAACRRLHDAGFRLVVATNQPDVGRGLQTRAAVEAMHARLVELVPEIELIQVCYHAGTAHGQPCDCRKPRPGLLLEAVRRLDLDLAASWMIGDRWRDVDCGRAAGCRTVFLDRGYDEPLRSAPDFVAADLAAAAGIVLAQPPPAPSLL